MREFDRKDFYSISEVEKLTGIKKYTIRYWEGLGLFHSIRIPSTYRRYTNENLNDILKIKDLVYNKNYSTKMVKLFFFLYFLKKENKIEELNIMKNFIFFIKKEVQKIINIID